MLDFIIKLLGKRQIGDLVGAPRMTRMTWIALQQGRPRSAFES
jgi:hypothetical protein